MKTADNVAASQHDSVPWAAAQAIEYQRTVGKMVKDLAGSSIFRTADELDL